MIPIGDSNPSMRSPIATPKVEKVFGWAKKEAETLQHQYIGTEQRVL